MNGRFGPAIVAFAVSTAVVTHASTLSEFFVQLRDPNLLGAPIFAALLHGLGYSFVLSLCAVSTGAAVILVAWRTRVRGATDWYASLAAVLAVLCFTSRLGVSLDPIGWVCTGAVCLLLDRDDDASAINTVALVIAWSLLQGGATLGALLSIFSFLGALVDERSFDLRVRRKGLVAAACCIAGSLQLHALPWHAYGPHALYLDALSLGAQRDRIWGGAFPVSAIGFSLIVVVAAWYGVRRKAQTAESLAFFGTLVLALLDARNLPYFGIVAAPIAADAVASYYVNARTFPIGTVRQYLVSFIAAAAVFAAALTANEPKVRQWPVPQDSSLRLVASAAEAPERRVLCENPRWCDGIEEAVLDDRAGIATPKMHKVQFDVSHVNGSWRKELAANSVDEVVAGKDDSIETLLLAQGWKQSASEGARVLLQRGDDE